MAVRVTDLIIEGFTSYATETVLDLSTVDLAVIVGPNGAGKSSLIDAIIWALAGETRDDANSVITAGQDSVRVVVTLEVDGRMWRITRSRSLKGRTAKGQVLIETEDPSEPSGWKQIGSGQRGEAETEIRRILGAPWSALAATTFASQGDISRFSRAEPRERKEILSQILELDRFAPLAEQAKVRLREHENVTKQLQGALGQVETTLAQIDEGTTRERLTEAEQALDHAQQQRDTDHEKVRELTAALNNLRRDETEAESLREQIREETGRVAADLAAARKAHQQAVRAAEHAVDAQRRARERLDAAVRAAETVPELENELGELTTRIEELETEVTDSGERIVAAQADVATAENQIGTCDSELARVNKRLSTVPEAGETECYACGQPVTETHLEHLVGGLRTELDEITARRHAAEQALVGAREELLTARETQKSAQQQLSRTRKKLEQVRAAHTAAVTRAEDREPAEQEKQAADTAVALAREAVENAAVTVERLSEDPPGLVALKERLARFGDLTEQIEETEELLTLARTHAQETEELLTRLSVEIGVLRQKLEDSETARTERNRLIGELDAATRRKDINQVLVNAFGADGIPALILGTVIPVLNEYANDVLNRLSGGRLAVEIVSDFTGVRGGKPVTTVDVKVSEGDQTRPYRTFSGGERMRVDLALRVGLAKLLAHRSGIPIRMLVVDEPDGLDAEGMNAFADCLRELTEDFSLIMVVSHQEMLASLFPTVIRVERDAYGSMVTIDQQ